MNQRKEIQLKFFWQCCHQSAHCPIITNFEFELLCCIFCQACSQVVLMTEVSNYVSIDVPQEIKTCHLSIQSTVDFFFRAEELEYKCGKCNHKSFVAVHKFNSLLSVFIHFKFYSFNAFWLLRKDVQEVIVSKCLKLSFHFNENTKPPVPLSKNAYNKNFKFLKVFQNIHSDNLNSLISLTKLPQNLSIPWLHTLGQTRSLDNKKTRCLSQAEKRSKKVWENILN